MKQTETVQSLSTFVEEGRQTIDSALKEWFRASNERIAEAAGYSLFSPSKRIRPLFCLETCRAFTNDSAPAIPAAMALEMIHTYSLIHDDLPSMDNDDLRRGKPTNHKVYGEAMAILAGDGLLTAAFEVLATARVSAELRISWVRELSQAAGMNGMVLGQALDMLPVRTAELASLEKLHRLKTAALLSASVVMGALAAGCESEIIEKLRRFAQDMGLAFQIRDDVLDIVGGQEIGKPVRSDERNSKPTYVSLLGIEGAQKEGERVYEKALDTLASIRFPYENRLEALTRFVVERRV